MTNNENHAKIQYDLFDSFMKWDKTLTPEEKVEELVHQGYREEFAAKIVQNRSFVDALTRMHLWTVFRALKNRGKNKWYVNPVKGPCMKVFEEEMTLKEMIESLIDEGLPRDIATKEVMNGRYEESYKAHYKPPFQEATKAE